jgi:plasmid maintenance system antidote protein VapI
MKLERTRQILCGTTDIGKGKRAITAEADLPLCRFFGLSNGYWLRAQAAHDTEVAERVSGAKLLKIKPWPAIQGHSLDALSNH